MKKALSFFLIIILSVLLFACSEIQFPEQTAPAETEAIERNLPEQSETENETVLPDNSPVFTAKTSNVPVITPTPEITATPTPTATPTAAPTAVPTPKPTEKSIPKPINSTFEIHFIDVGQGDAILVECDGRFALIDGGNSKQSDKIYSYLKKRGIDTLDYIIAAHSDSDHIGGLSGALNFAKAKKAFAPVINSDAKAFINFKKYLGYQNVSITVPVCGESFNIGSAVAYFLAPQYNYSDDNNNSLVIKIVYGNTSFLLTGDAETKSESDMISAGVNLSADVIKIGHHGSSSSNSSEFLDKTRAKYAVISVGKDNSYGHPTEETLNKLKQRGMTILRTDQNGTIIFESDGKELTYSIEKVYTPSTPTPKPTPKATPVERSIPEQSHKQYIGNVNSSIFHDSDCSSLPLEKNRVYFDSRDAAVAAGYRPCKRCNP